MTGVLEGLTIALPLRVTETVAEAVPRMPAAPTVDVMEGEPERVALTLGEWEALLEACCEGVCVAHCVAHSLALPLPLRVPERVTDAVPTLLKEREGEGEREGDPETVMLAPGERVAVTEALWETERVAHALGVGLAPPLLLRVTVTVAEAEPRWPSAPPEGETLPVPHPL